MLAQTTEIKTGADRFLNLETVLHSEALLALIKGQLLAIRVRHYYPENFCQRVQERLSSEERMGVYSTFGAEEIGRDRLSYYETHNNPVHWQQYYAQAGYNIREIREIFDPYYSPIDRLRLNLDEVWPAGAHLENIDGLPMFVGLTRLLKEGSYIFPHNDNIQEDSNFNPRAREIRIQLAANVYLNMPESGGSLLLWDASMLPENLSHCLRQDGYGFDPEKIGLPKLEIQPEIGDLILFNSRYLHSVSRVGVGGRLSSSCFIGFRSFNRPLSYWS